MFLFALGIMGEAIHKILYPVIPGVETMGIVGWPLLQIWYVSSFFTGTGPTIST